MGNIAKKKAIIMSAIITVAILIIIYLSVSVYFQYHFMSGTKINGVDFSYKTVGDVEDYFKDSARTYYLEISERNNKKEHISAEDVGLLMVVDGDVKALLKSQNAYMWLFKAGEELTLSTKVSFDESLLLSRFKTLDCLNEELMVAGEGCKFSYNDGKYVLEEAKPGTKLDIEMVKNAIKDAISKLDKILDLEKLGCYDIGLSEAEAKYNECLKTLNEYVNVKITLTFDENLENKIISCDEINKWLSVDENLEIVIDRDAVVEYVSQLSKDIETMGQTRHFKNSYGNEVKIHGGDYGWWVSEGAEADAIISDIRNKVDVERPMNFLQKAASFGENDLGDTYIEVNLLKQHLFCYKEGQLITECDIISGDSDTPTPTGIFRMRFMFKNYNVRRPNFDKTVAYWMVFYGDSVETNIGIMSCDFREDFGGTTYLYNGSLGSIYIPYDNAKIIYEQIPNDIPVVIYKNY